MFFLANVQVIFKLKTFLSIKIFGELQSFSKVKIEKVGYKTIIPKNVKLS